jgi:hypothetical protein
LGFFGDLAGPGFFGSFAFLGFGGFFGFGALGGAGGGLGFCISRLTEPAGYMPVTSGVKPARIRKAMTNIIVFIGLIA